MQATETIIPVLGILASFGLPVMLVAIILYYKHRKALLMHETIAKLAEKGLPVPTELLTAPSPRHGGLRSGLVLVALGIALAIFFLEQGRTWSIGLIPGLMGVAMLIAWRIETRENDRKTPPA